MRNWVKEVINKYTNTRVKYNNSLWTIKKVVWDESKDELFYWIEDSNQYLKKVNERNIEYITI